MIKIQCDKNLNKILLKLLKNFMLDAEVIDLSEQHANIAIIRNSESASRISAEYLIINSDDKLLAKNLPDRKCKIISCGFSNRSTMTVSSITENECVLCLQRSLKTISGKRISPFDLPVKLSGIKFDVISVIMMITAALLCDIPISQLNKIEL